MGGKANIMRLDGMDDVAADMPPWEAEWMLFGPIPSAGDTATWPGKIGFNPLPLDAAATIPEQARIMGIDYRAVKTPSLGGNIDFFDVFPRHDGCPIAYMMTEVETPRPCRWGICFGANWGTQWWLNGELAYETISGNESDPKSGNNQFQANLRQGRNVFTVKVVSGGPGWSIALGKTLAPPQRRQRLAETGRAEAAPRPTRDWSLTALRIEERPGPVDAKTAKMKERAMAAHGVNLHWLGVVNHDGSPYADSEDLGSLFKTHYLDEAHPRATSWDKLSTTDPEEAAKHLAFQVGETRRQGMAAISWFPGTHCRSAAALHPEWRTVALASDAPAIGESNWRLCVNTPYGEALSKFLGDALRRYGLDGFWLDGASWANAANLGCACAACRRKFEADEGFRFPEQADWADPAFRRWVAWRHRTFMDFWGKLAARLRREVPHTKVVVNHLHRLGISWQTAIPIDRYDAEVAVGTESAGSVFESAFHARLVRAYGKADAEVWMGLHNVFSRRMNWPEESQPVYRYAHHALATMAGGAMPSFGTPDLGEKLTDAYDLLAALIHPRRAAMGGTAEPYVGLHLSQQAETFHFSRRKDWGHPGDYWNSVFGYHNLFMEKQLLQDVIFDAQLTPGGLAAYPVVVMPLSVALSDRQTRLLEEYVAEGGVLVVGPSLGARDEWGSPPTRGVCPGSSGMTPPRRRTRKEASPPPTQV